MTEDEFRRAVQLGLGRARQFARATKPMPYRQVVLDSVTRCDHWDPQTNGTFAEFTWDLARDSDLESEACAALLDSLQNCPDDWDTVKQFWTAKLAVAGGHNDLRAALYRAFDPGPTHGDALAVCLLHMDGIAGLVYVAEKAGEALNLGTADWVSRWIISAAWEALGREAVDTALREAAATNPAIQRYRSHVAAEEEIPSSEQLREVSQSFNELRTGRGPVWRWAGQASADELRIAAEALLQATSDDDRRWLLGIFRRRPFPLGPYPLMALAGSAGDQSVAMGAALALSKLTGEPVRRWALGLAQVRPEWRDVAVDALAANFQEEDHARILKWLDESGADPEPVHNLATSVRQFWKSHPHSASASRVWEWIYERNPCAFCRQTAVEQMIEESCLPAHIAAECAFDANDEIRGLVAHRLDTIAGSYPPSQP